MWLFELVLLSLMLGVPLGIGLRVWDEWQEKAKAEANQKANEVLGKGWVERNQETAPKE